MAGLAVGLAGLALLPVLLLLVQTLAAFLPRRRTVPVRPAGVQGAVLVPAHDEAQGIAATLDGLRAQLQPQDRLLVVADNCSDETAEVAAARGDSRSSQRGPLAGGLRKGHQAPRL